jgi:hypothetical protein
MRHTPNRKSVCADGRHRYGVHVPAQMRQLKRRNHTVNESYLRRFADDRGLLTMVPLPGDVRVPVSVNDAAVIKNFYVIQLDDGSETDEAEDLFSVVEGNAAAAIRALVDQLVWPIPADARTAIAEWVALQYLRVPAVRRLAREVVEGFCGTGIPFTTGSGERVMLRIPAEDMDRLSGPGFHLEFIKRQAARVAGMLYERGWLLTFYERRSLATSDTPVVLRPADGHPAGRGTGIANAGEIHVPLDRHVALSISAGPPGDGRTAGVTKTALYLNDAMAKNARRYVFHHPGDDPFRGLTLPEPRERELASPESAAALIQDALG